MLSNKAPENVDTKCGVEYADTHWTRFLNMTIAVNPKDAATPEEPQSWSVFIHRFILFIETGMIQTQTDGTHLEAHYCLKCAFIYNKKAQTRVNSPGLEIVLVFN